MKKSINIILLELLGPFVQNCRLLFYKFRGYKNISRNVILERGLNLDRVYPSEIYISDGCLIASKVTILTHEHVIRDPKNPIFCYRSPVKIGKNCFIGVGAIILPGVTIGDSCIIAAGSIVKNDIPSNSLAAGVPAIVKRSDIVLNSKAILCN